MSHIALSKSAVEKVVGDPQWRQWKNEGSGRRVPILAYFGRCYATSNDGTVTEHGDGFSLTTIDLAEAKETKGIVLESVAVADGLDILVGADEAIMLGSFVIGWSKWRFTYEPQVSA